MLGWVITCHDDKAQDMLHRLEKKYGPLAQCQLEYAKPHDVPCSACYRFR